MPSPATAFPPPARVPPSAAQSRIIDATIDLFARHGVGGTSFQMIADEIGVTKAAVYHQFNTKDQLILAVAESELARLDDVVTAAEDEPSAKQSRDTLLGGMVDLTVDRGRKATALLSDPVLGNLFVDHEPFRGVIERLHRLLVGDDAPPEAHLQVTMLIAALSGAVMHPFSSQLEDELLRQQLLRLARRFLGLPR